MTEGIKRELIEKICEYGTLKGDISRTFEKKEFEEMNKFIKEKDKLLSEIVNIIKNI